MGHSGDNCKIIMLESSPLLHRFACDRVLVQPTYEIIFYPLILQLAANVLSIPSHLGQADPIVQIGQAVHLAPGYLGYGGSDIRKHIGRLLLGIEDVETPLSLSDQLQEPGCCLVLYVSSLRRKVFAACRPIELLHQRGLLQKLLLPVQLALVDDALVPGRLQSQDHTFGIVSVAGVNLNLQNRNVQLGIEHCLMQIIPYDHAATGS